MSDGGKTLVMKFDSAGNPFAVSVIIWAIIALISINSIRVHHMRKRFIQRDIIFLLTCNIILRLFWYLRQTLDGGFSNIFLNRIAILVQLTGLVLLFQTWFKSISDNPRTSTNFKYASFGVVVFAWAFMLATVFQCIKSYCIWYEVNIVFIGCISLALALGVLIYGIMVRKRLMDLSNENLMNSAVYNARLRQAHQLFKICGVIVVLFTIRACLFGLARFVDLGGFDLYPWWFYQVFIYEITPIN
jgi:hypothetical protein